MTGRDIHFREVISSWGIHRGCGDKSCGETGKDISTMSKQYGYGSGFYKILSDDLKGITGC